MKTIAEAFPNLRVVHDDWVEMNHPGYNELIQSTGVSVLVSLETDDYSGDCLMLLSDGKRFGYLIFGYGSCSGCDALQACETTDEVEELRNHLYHSIRWEETFEEMLSFLENHDWETDCYGNRHGRQFIEKVKAWRETV